VRGSPGVNNCEGGGQGSKDPSPDPLKDNLMTGEVGATVSEFPGPYAGWEGGVRGGQGKWLVMSRLKFFLRDSPYNFLYSICFSINAMTVAPAISTTNTCPNITTPE